jgi:hypothetical protein
MRKCHFLFEHGFSRKKDSKPCLKFHMEEVVPPFYRMMSDMLVLVDALPTSGRLELAADLRLRVVFTDSYNHKSTSFLTVFDRYGLHLVSCEVWKWVIYLSFEE